MNNQIEASKDAIMYLRFLEICTAIMVIGLLANVIVSLPSKEDIANNEVRTAAWHVMHDQNMEVKYYENTDKGSYWHRRYENDTKTMNQKAATYAKITKQHDE